MTQHVVYDNTVENARSVGWLNFPEYCVGDVTTARKVTHDTVKGVFLFHNNDTSDIGILLHAFRS